jgi:hypothetical protein
MTSVAVIHYPGATEKSRSVVASLVADQLSLKHSVKVIDISAFTTISQDFPPQWVAATLGHRVDHEAFRAEILRLGGEYVFAEPPQHAVELDDEQVKAIEASVESELLTYFRTDRLEEVGARAHRLRSKLWIEVARTYRSLDKLFSTHRPDTLIIPNGRTSRQKTARVLAEHLGIKVLFYENGRARPDHYYLGTTQPHDRIASQAELPDLTASLNPSEIAALARKFLDLRMGGGSGTNEFSTSWSDAESIKEEPTSSSQRAVFFSSSFDEYLAFGEMWLIDSWNYQFEDFDRIMTILEEENIALEMRLHPNLANKSRAYFRREIANVKSLKAKHPQLVIHWHNSSTNSYGLLAQADLVFVERSTTGLEASLMSKPVWITQASQWDEVADIRRLLAPEDINPQALKPWDVDPSGAERFAAYWMIQEHPLHYSWKNWSSWNVESAPIILKIASLFGKNPWSHRWHLLRAEWVKWRNRRFSPPATRDVSN